MPKVIRGTQAARCLDDALTSATCDARCAIADGRSGVAGAGQRHVKQLRGLVRQVSGRFQLVDGRPEIGGRVTERADEQFGQPGLQDA
ncbi:hypothetical protein ABZ807_28610 [Micromonospora sp. NPDC047548]|uniref:hypothetical protein n=1 Tax=Micromonospora sp. NPDC047548 TaxID=3155624 RepID=UPI0033FD7FBB